MIHLHQNDLPANVNMGPLVAIDTETMGLNPARDRLCPYPRELKLRAG